jgi:hypothetical protein
LRSTPVAHGARYQRWSDYQPEQQDSGEHCQHHLPPAISHIDGHWHGGGT